jgi:cell division protein FtsL
VNELIEIDTPSVGRNSRFEAIFAKETYFSSCLMYLAVFIIVILSAVALFLFQYMNQKRKIRQEEMHERKRQQFEELLKLISDKNDQGSDTTEVDKNS